MHELEASPAGSELLSGVISDSVGHGDLLGHSVLVLFEFRSQDPLSALIVSRESSSSHLRLGCVRYVVGRSTKARHLIPGALCTLGCGPVALCGISG